MKVTVKRKSSHSATMRHSKEDTRWRNGRGKKAGPKNNGRAAIRASVVPRMARRGA